MKALINLANKVKNLSIDELMIKLASEKSFTDFIIELNTQKQLFEKGVDAKGRLLSDIGGDYAASTIEGTSTFKGKKELGLPYDHITLFQTGEFYESFKVYLNGRDFIISADTVKDTSDLISDWGRDILGLNENSLILLREKASIILINHVKMLLLQR